MKDQATIETPQEMRNQHFPCRSQGEDQSLKEYLADLTSRGITLNPKLYPSKFHLENGLSYVGMATRQKIKGGEVLIRVPQDLILSADKAYSEPALTEVFKERFFIQEKDNENDEDEIDDDKIIIVYALFLLTKREENNLWYQMVKGFPEVCDIACFWSEEELDEIKDKTLKSGAQLRLRDFEKEWSSFEQIQKKYELLQEKEFSKNNYRRVYITLSNRAFGYQVKYVSLVPMAEYFNHHASKVSYSLEKRKQTYLSEENDENSQTSSVGSCDSFQFMEVGEFDYEKCELNLLDWAPDVVADLDFKEKDKIMKEVNFFIDQLDDLLNWKDFTIIFIAHLIHTAKTIQKRYFQGEKTYQKVMMDIKVLKKTLEKYKNQVVEYYQSIKKKEYIPKPKVKAKNDKFEFKEPTKLYESLIIKTSSSDKIESDNQIYFRYGHNCNRSLLLHYGFAIRGNKYEHCWMNFNVGDCLSDFPDTLQKIKEKRLSLFRKFKIYHHRLNIDMIIFFRLNSWTFYGENAVDDIFYVTDTEREIAILSQIVAIIDDYVELYEGDYDLTDKSLNYHQYFIAVYHLQKLTIFKKQAKLFKLLIDLLKKIEEGSSLKEAAKHLTQSERTVLKPYLSSIKI